MHSDRSIFPLPEFPTLVVNLWETAHTGPGTGPSPSADPLPPSHTLSLQIAGALSYLHACGVLHGDLTGTAVLLTSVPQDQRRWVAKLSDFGLAELVARGQGRTRALARASVASLAHWAPEVLVGGVLSEEGDVYSLGVLLWEMCAGRSAWEGLTAPQILQTVGREGRTPALALLPETIPQDLKVWWGWGAREILWGWGGGREIWWGL